MPEINDELARSIRAVLEWMGTDPETAGAALGINSRTLSAMEQGIVPMRSLVLRFADGVRNRCERETGVPDWWRDADAWLRVAGYPPRRDGAATPADRMAARSAGGSEGQRAGMNGSGRVAAPPPPVDPHENAPASDFYHPIYERKPFGDSFVHVFWVLDGDSKKVFHRTMRADWDYKAEAARLKQDLGKMTKGQFDRKYGRFRYHGQQQDTHPIAPPTR
ncbi:MAG: hypothetical protein K0Q72_3837 [Armatimonadetes bacterium]|jgi:hypothetical protein|nr:hypothetical protein [Armatimonadota bacterium]